MRVRAESSSPIKKRTLVLCAFCFEDNTSPIGLGKLQRKIDEAVLQSVKEIKGKKNKIAIRHGFPKPFDKGVLITCCPKKEMQKFINIFNKII